MLYWFLIAVSLCTYRHSNEKFFESLRLPLAKGSSTSNQAFSIVFTTLSVPLAGDRNLRRKDVTALRCSEPLRYKVGGASKPSPGCAGRDNLIFIFYDLSQKAQNENLNELILLRYCSYQTKSKVYHSLYGIPYSSS